MEQDDDGSPLYGQPIEHVQLFPGRLKDSRPIEDSYCLPSRVRAIYEETHAAVRNSQPILAGIGVRALIEAVCADRGASGRNLVDKIDDLVKLGVLTKAGADILHGTRVLGNKAAHEVSPPTTDELLAAVKVVHNLLENVFILPRVAARLPRDKRQGP